MAHDPYEEMAALYREKVAKALREGGVGTATADRVVEEWSDNCRAAWAVGRSPRSTARDLAMYEGLAYRAPAPLARRKRRTTARRR